MLEKFEKCSPFFQSEYGIYALAHFMSLPQGDCCNGLRTSTWETCAIKPSFLSFTL